MNISLMGFSGTGKTVVSRLLARRLDKKLISTNEELASRTGLSIEKMAKRHGWGRLLEAESEVIESVSDLDECVFDTGSSTVLRNENVTNLKKNGLIIFLTADSRVIESRIRRGQEKTDFAKREYIDKVKGVLDEWQEKYKKAADYTIDTTTLSPEEVCDLITHYIQMELH